MAYERDGMGGRMPFSTLQGHRPDGSGQRSLEDYPGQVLVINFWASWCPPCLAEMPTLQRLAARFRGRPFKVLAINVSDPPLRVRRLSSLWGDDIEFLMDGNGAEAKTWDVRYYPTTFVTDARGRLVHRVRGEMDWDSDEAIAWIEQLLASPEP